MVGRKMLIEVCNLTWTHGDSVATNPSIGLDTFSCSSEHDMMVINDSVGLSPSL